MARKQLRLSLTFSSAYTGNLHLYALDWDSHARRETIAVGAQTATLSERLQSGCVGDVPGLGGRWGNDLDRRHPHGRRQRRAVGRLPRRRRAAPGPPVANAQGTLIPLYDNGNPANWAEACSQTNGSGGGSWIIADVAEGAGPGSASVPAWASVIDNCYSYGRASVIGYVWTDYGEGGQASIAGIESQIDAWYSYYPGAIAGIFFDGVSDEVPGTTMSNQSFYQTLASYVHTHEGPGNEVVYNFGANPGSGWMFNGGAANRTRTSP